jgi:hypothetical protein
MTGGAGHRVGEAFRGQCNERVFESPDPNRQTSNISVIKITQRLTWDYFLG